MEINFEWYKIKSKKNNTQNINIKAFADKIKQAEYKTEVRESIQEIKNQESSRDKWNTVCTVCSKAGKKILGNKTSNKQHPDKELEELAKNKKKAKDNMNSCKDNTQRKQLAKEKKEIKTRMTKRLKLLEEQLNNKLEEIESMKNDSTKMLRCTARTEN